MTGETWFVIALLGGFCVAMEVFLVPASLIAWWQRHEAGWANIWWVALIHIVVWGSSAVGVAVHLRAAGLRAAGF